MHLFLDLVPPPHVAEQDVHEPQGPTSQSTENKREFKTPLYPFNHTREAASHVAGVCFYQLNYPELCAFLPIILGVRNVLPVLEIRIFKCLNPYLVLFFFPSPQVAEQDDQDPHFPTSQSTIWKNLKILSTKGRNGR